MRLSLKKVQMEGTKLSLQIVYCFGCGEQPLRDILTEKITVRAVKDHELEHLLKWIDPDYVSIRSNHTVLAVVVSVRRVFLAKRLRSILPDTPILTVIHGMVFELHPPKKNKRFIGPQRDLTGIIHRQSAAIAVA